MGLLKKLGHLPCSREALIIEVIGGDENIQIFKNKKSGSREHDLVGESRMILAT